MGRWLRAGDLRQAGEGLPWWGARGDAPAIVRFAHVADSVARSGAEPALKEEGVFGTEAAQAYLALARRDTADALQRFERMPDSLCARCEYLIMARQRLQAARGEDRRVLGDAERWVWYPIASEVSGTLDVARAAERLGEREQALRGYLGRLTSEPKP